MGKYPDYKSEDGKDALWINEKDARMIHTKADGSKVTIILKPTKVEEKPVC